MPTYEYRCPEGHEFELFQKISDEPRAQCPTCGAESERILSGGAGFLFKGEGFYATDYRSESYRKEASKEGKGDAKDGAKASPGKGEKSSGTGSGEKASGSPGSDTGKGSPGDATAGSE